MPSLDYTDFAASGMASVKSITSSGKPKKQTLVSAAESFGKFLGMKIEIA